MMLPTFTDVTGLGGIAVALASAVWLIPGVSRLARSHQAGLFAGGVLLVLVPVGTLPMAAYARGVTGDLSLTTLVLLAGAIVRRLGGTARQESWERERVAAFVVLTAFALYPMALGTGMFDPYRLGYGSFWLLGVLLAVAVTAWWWRLKTIALCLALATLAWVFRWYESTNLWDYLVDPWVSFYAMGSLVMVAVRRAKNGWREGRAGEGR